MAGFLNPPASAASPPAASASAPAGPMPEDDTRLAEGEDGREPATPEEQAQYDAFVKEGMKLIYAKGQVNPGILKLLDDDPQDLIAILGEEVGQDFSPVIALAATATIVVLEVVRRADPKPEGEIIMHGGAEILEDLADLAGQPGPDGQPIHTYTEDDVNQAMIHAVNLYRITATQAGMLDEEALAQEFADILNAQEDGTLGKMLPGIERYENGGVR